MDTKNQQKVVDVGSSLIHKLLRKHGLSFDDISVLVPLNTTPFVWQYYAKQLGISLKKVFLKIWGRAGTWEMWILSGI